MARLLDTPTPASALEEVAGQSWREAVRRSIRDGSDACLGEDDLREAALDHVFGPRAYPPRTRQALLRTAVHEIGHALAALAYGIPIRIVSCRRGYAALGVTGTVRGEHGPERLADGLAQLRIGLAGALAEIEAGLGQGGGESGDVAMATRRACELVVSHGLTTGGRVFDPTALGGMTGPSRSAPAVSEWLLAQVDRDAASLLERAARDVRALLGQIGREAILSLAERLVERETMDGVEFENAVREVLAWHCPVADR